MGENEINDKIDKIQGHNTGNVATNHVPIVDCITKLHKTESLEVLNGKGDNLRLICTFDLTLNS